MPAKPRKQFTPAFKAKVALEAIKGESTSTVLGRTFSIHPNLVGIWKRQALEACRRSLPTRDSSIELKQMRKRTKLYRKIGQLKVELDWIKKVWTFLLMSADNGSIPTIRV